jgi:hypothetical protein
VFGSETAGVRRAELVGVFRRIVLGAELGEFDAAQFQAADEFGSEPLLALRGVDRL